MYSEVLVYFLDFSFGLDLSLILLFPTFSFHGASYRVLDSSALFAQENFEKQTEN